MIMVINDDGNGNGNDDDDGGGGFQGRLCLLIENNIQTDKKIFYQNNFVSAP